MLIASRPNRCGFPNVIVGSHRPANPVAPFRPSENRFQATAKLAVFALTALRAILAPCLIGLAIKSASGWAFIACLTLGFLSDIYDGVLARRFGVATPALRRFDSITDDTFYLSATVAAWLIYPSVIRDNLTGLCALAVLGMTRTTCDLVKFGRTASYHMWSAKFWGITLFAAFVALLGFGNPLLVPLGVAAGIVADLEGLAGSMILHEWTHDLPSVFHAWSIARQIRPK